MSAVNYTGKRFGSITVVKLATSTPRTWLMHCSKCGSEWNADDRTVSVYSQTDSPLRCRLEACYTGRLPEKIVTKYQRDYLDAPEPQPIPDPVSEPAPIIPIVEHPSTDYLRYVSACVQVRQAQVIPWREFERMSSFMRDNLMQRVAAIEERE